MLKIQDKRVRMIQSVDADISVVDEGCRSNREVDEVHSGKKEGALHQQQRANSTQYRRITRIAPAIIVSSSLKREKAFGKMGCIGVV